MVKIKKERTRRQEFREEFYDGNDPGLWPDYLVIRLSENINKLIRGMINDKSMLTSTLVTMVSDNKLGVDFLLDLYKEDEGLTDFMRVINAIYNTDAKQMGILFCLGTVNLPEEEARIIQQYAKWEVTNTAAKIYESFSHTEKLEYQEQGCPIPIFKPIGVMKVDADTPSASISTPQQKDNLLGKYGSEKEKKSEKHQKVSFKKDEIIIN